MLLFQLIIILMLSSGCHGELRMAFPTHDFLELSGVKYLGRIDYLYPHECDTSNGTYCSCDETCILNPDGQCCIDYLWSNTLLENNNIFKHQEMLLNKSKSQSCLPLSKNSTDYFIMVDSCISKSDLVKTSKCMSDDGLPVIGNDNFLYKNKECAECNNVFAYSFPEMEYNCSSEPNSCSFNPIHQLSRYIHKCDPERCSREKATLCRVFESQIMWDFKFYKNLFCGDCLTMITGSVPYPWNKLVDIIPYENYGSERIECNEEEVNLLGFGVCCKEGEENIMGVCENITQYSCGNGYEMIAGKCVEIKSLTRKQPVHSSYLDNRTMSLLVFTTKMNKNTNETAKMIKKIELQLDIVNASWDNINFDKNTTVIKTNVIYNRERHNNVFLKTIENMDKMIKQIVVYSSTSDIHQSLMYGSDYRRIFDNTKVCASLKRLSITNTTLSQSNASSYQEILSSLQNGKLRNTSSLNFEIIFSKGQIKEYFYYCEMYHLHTDCLRKNIKHQDFDGSIGENDTLMFSISGKRHKFNAPEYVPTKDGFQICWRKTETASRVKFAWYSTTQDIGYYISIVGTSFSFIGYVVLFVAFYLIVNLRNTGGVYVLILAVILFMVDAVFIGSGLAENNSSICKWLGFLLHLVSVLLCLWTAVVAVDLVLQFARHSMGKSKSKKLIYKKLLLCSVLTIVLFLVILSLNETGTVNFNYQSSCWIGNPYLLLAFYFVPVVLVYLLCIFCLSTIVYSIHRQSKAAKEVLTSSNRNNVNLHKIAIKLIIILGVSEILGLIQIPKSNLEENELIFNVIFGIIYNILRSFRGFLICVVYLSNKKTVKLFKTYMGRESEGHEMSSLTKHTTVG